MTERAGVGGAGVLASAALVFVAVLVVLSLRMRAGEDPALRLRHPPRPAPRRVLVRRVLERRVVVQLPSGAAARAASASQQIGAAGTFEAGAPLDEDLMSGRADITFRSMGSDVRLIVEAPLLEGGSSAAEAAERERLYIEDFAARLSRFRPDSELSALNLDPRSEVPASRLMRAAVTAGLWAAERSGGLVDPTLLGEIEAAGYDESREAREPASLAEALAAAPPRRPASPSARARWHEVGVDDEHGTVVRPPGVGFDTGGTGKGLAADAVARRLVAHRRFVVDCGGDIAVGGPGALFDPVLVEIEHPLTGETIGSVELRAGGVATSGLNVRIWRNADGTYAHHLIDPGTGRPAWSGLIGATALAPSALEAETLSKLALLSGPLGARRALSAHGGVIVHDDGAVEWVLVPQAERGTQPAVRSAA